MINAHTEPEDNTALTEPPTPAIPASAPPADYRPPASQAWYSLGCVALGMVLAVGGDDRVHAVSRMTRRQPEPGLHTG